MKNSSSALTNNKIFNLALKLFFHSAKFLIILKSFAIVLLLFSLLTASDQLIAFRWRDVITCNDIDLFTDLPLSVGSMTTIAIGRVPVLKTEEKSQADKASNNDNKQKFRDSTVSNKNE